jgi:hypothetical protein
MTEAEWIEALVGVLLWLALVHGFSVGKGST